MFQKVKFLAQHKEFNKYPVKEVSKMDVSPDDGEKPLSLDQFFMDDIIEELIIRHIEEEDLNEDFYTEYPEVSDCIYCRMHPSQYACNKLGFTRVTDTK